MSFNRTTEQRRRALESANEVRLARAWLKLEVRRGKRQPIDVLQDPPVYALRMKVYDLLLAVPHMGHIKVTRLLVLCEVSPQKTIGGLTDRQRKAVVRCLERARVGVNRSNRPSGTSLPR